MIEPNVMGDVRQIRSYLKSGIEAFQQELKHLEEGHRLNENIVHNLGMLTNYISRYNSNVTILKILKSREKTKEGR